MLRFILCWYSQEYTAALLRRHIAAKPNSALADQPRGKKLSTGHLRNGSLA